MCRVTPQSPIKVPSLKQEWCQDITETLSLGRRGFGGRKGCTRQPKRARSLRNAPAPFTLFSNFDLSAPELRLLDVFHAEIAAAFGVLLLLVSGGGLIVGAVCVGGSWRKTKRSEAEEDAP